MSRSKILRLTPALQQRIAASIRAGGYPHVAAQAAGVAAALFDAWLERGRTGGAREPYRSFAEDIREAAAQARLNAEIALFREDPKLWLTHGPGRDSADNPGWSAAVKPASTETIERNALLDPVFLAMMRELIQALEPFPEAQRRLIQLANDRAA